MSRDIFLNIDTIVLRGLNHLDRQALVEAVQQALLQQFESNPGLTTANLSRVSTNINLPANFGTEQMGQALGQSLSTLITNTAATKKSAAKSSQGGQDHG